MIGDLLSKIREDKNISKTNIAKETNINVEQYILNYSDTG